MTPQVLDHAGIAARIPHSGAMCLLGSVLGWSASEMRCRIVNHADLSHPLRSTSGLLSACAIEYAAQAMALHGAVSGPPRTTPRRGVLASARGVRLFVPRLDDASGPLDVGVVLVAGDHDRALYRFELRDAAGRILVDGRASVVLDRPLPQPGTTS